MVDCLAADLDDVAAALADRDALGRAERRIIEIFDPNLGGTVSFDWGKAKLVQAFHTSTMPGSAPCSPSQFATSTIATTGAPVRSESPTASARWSTWPWVTSTCVASTSSAEETASGLFGFRKGSITTWADPSESSKHEWPW